MRYASVGAAALLMVLTWSSNAVFAQGWEDFGKREYQSNCASCHGASGKGDGALVRQLVKAPPDLTTLARRNGGVYPSQRVWDMIDGRTSTEIGPHGTREMPVWGNVFEPWYARNRITSLVDYLAQIQAR